MKTPLLTRKSQNASSLVVAVFIMALLGVFIGLAFDYTANTARITNRAANYTAAQAIANGTLEAMYKKWGVYMAAHQNLAALTANTSTSNFTTNIVNVESPVINAASVPLGYSVVLSLNAVDRSDTAKDGAVATDASVSPIPSTPGWVATTYNYCARVDVTNTNTGMKISVSRYFQQAEASLFQAMLFFQNDLEIHPGPAMTLYGLVHTNSNLYAAAGSGGSLTFSSNVSFHGNQATLNPAANYKYENSAGYVEGVTATLYQQEGSGNWGSYNAPVYANNRNAQLSNVGSLSPLGTDVTGAIDASNPNTSGTHELIERPAPASATNPNASGTYSDPDSYKSHRVYNTPGSLRVFINHTTAYKTSGSGTAQNIHVYTPASATDLENSTEIIPGDGTKSKPYNIANQVINAITLDNGTGDIYDFREGRAINATTVDMSVLTPVLNNYATSNPDYTGVLYISDITNADSSGNTGNSDAIRIKKGGILPDIGLTVATDGAVYVQGDYNTGTTYGPDVLGQPVPLVQPNSNLAADPTQYTVSGYTQKPAAVIGDAVMILSNSWNDTNSSLAIASRVASPTTINTAVVSGDVLTTSTTGSGGAHNFPRFLENWGSKNFTYHGSMVELYASNHFTGTYGKANVYSAPNRRWFFDDKFLTTPPPGNLHTTTFARGRWIRNNI